MCPGKLIKIDNKGRFFFAAEHTTKDGQIGVVISECHNKMTDDHVWYVYINGKVTRIVEEILTDIYPW